MWLKDLMRPAFFCKLPKYLIAGIEGHQMGAPYNTTGLTKASNRVQSDLCDSLVLLIVRFKLYNARMALRRSVVLACDSEPAL